MLRTNGKSGCLVGYPGLACAIFARAWRDARSANGQRSEALAFLESDGARILLENLSETLGLDLDGSDLVTLAGALSANLTSR